jgi:K+-sensing histidine kinase KdpD
MMSYSDYMIRTQIQLPEVQYERLRQRAGSLRISIAEQIRQAIDLYFQKENLSASKEIREIAGKYEPISTEDLKDHDRWITDAIVESKIQKKK